MAVKGLTMRFLVVIFLVMMTVQAQDDDSSALIRADVHDPAQLVRSGDQLLLYASAVEWQAYDLNSQTWAFLGDTLYAEPPTWYDGEEAFWAPSLFALDDETYVLYHAAVEDEENHGSKIGFALGSGTGTEIEWRASDDFVVQSTGYGQPFAIDPAVFRDDEDRLWLIYGSHAAGISIVELNPETGLLLENPDDKTWAADDPRFTNIANYGGTQYDENNVEAAYIYNHPESEFYYLFVNWDRCCSGVESDYNIRVGRSTSPTGPFVDQDGVDMAEGGGTVFLDANGEILGDPRFIGPGHAGIYRHSDGLDYVSHHFYDGENNGAPSWALWQLDWVDGWPQIDMAHVVDLND